MSLLLIKWCKLCFQLKKHSNALNVNYLEAVSYKLFTYLPDQTKT